MTLSPHYARVAERTTHGMTLGDNLAEEKKTTTEVDVELLSSRDT